MAKKQSQTQKRKAAVKKQNQKKQQRNRLIGIIALLAIVAVAVFSFVSNKNVPTNVEGRKIAPEVGAEAPDFQLAGINGETVQLSDLRGQPVAVTFMHTWWPVCNASAPELRAAYEQYQDDGFVVLSISVQESETAVADFINRYGLNYPFVMDTDGSISKNYSVFSTPTTYFVNPDGVITSILPGLMTQQWIAANLEAIEG